MLFYRFILQKIIIIINLTSYMASRKEDSQSEEYEKTNKQKLKRKIETKRKRTTRKQAFQDGKPLIQCQYCPSDKRRRYQSYPALYTHVNLKHPGCKVSSAKDKDKSDNYPVFKMVNILAKQYPQNQQFQRNLITTKNICCLLMAQQILKKQDYSILSAKNQDQNLLDKIRDQAKSIATRINLEQYLFKNYQQAKIFQHELTKIFPISFGEGLVRYFSNKLQLSSKIYISLIILQNFDENAINGQQKEHFFSLIWGQNVNPMNILVQNWQKWKQILLKHKRFISQMEKGQF